MSSENNELREPARRRWLKVAAWSGAALATELLGAQYGKAARAQGSAVKTLRIGYQKYGAFVLLKARGTLEKRLASQGISVSWLEFPAGPQLLEGLNAGAFDIGTAGETPPIFAQAAGVEFVYIGNEPPAPASEAIVVPHDSPIKTVADLRGKKVALNKGSNVHYLLVRALENAGLQYADIRPAYLSPADARAAFTQGSIDAWAIWDPYFAAIEKQMRARVIADGAGLV
ncbi:MAG: sulfonate transport system substrate-binding protein, partial [Paraburkholderia sp.]|nr:sulfonate transport system substrate-binding protein [Paraburkholderia sp.]